MKKLVLIFIILIITLNTFAQSGVGTQKQIKEYFESTLCVVLEDKMMSDYNSYIQEIIPNCWQQTKYEFINKKEYEKRRKNSKYSFLVKSKIMFSRDKKNIPYLFLLITRGGSFSTIEDMPIICSFPLEYYNADDYNFYYKLPAICKFMQSHMQLTKNNSNLTDKNILQYYNKNQSSISNKTLYIDKEELSEKINTTNKIKKYYSGKVIITDQETLEEKISQKDQNGVFLHKVAPNNIEGRCFKVIMGMADGKLYYFDYHNIGKKSPNSLLTSDLKKF